MQMVRYLANEIEVLEEKLRLEYDKLKDAHMEVMNCYHEIWNLGAEIEWLKSRKEKGYE